jgi:cyclin G-associated kinase
VFGDLLGSQGYQFPKRETGPRTINEMRKEELAKDMDPDKLKVGSSMNMTMVWSCMM